MLLLLAVEVVAAEITVADAVAVVIVGGGGGGGGCDGKARGGNLDLIYLHCLVIGVAWTTEFWRFVGCSCLHTLTLHSITLWSMRELHILALGFIRGCYCTYNSIGQGRRAPYFNLL